MTIEEALKNTQNRKIGTLAKRSVRYAQSLLEPDETVTAAVIADVRTKRENYPGVAAITNRRVLAACGLPGIRRSISFPLDTLENCEEISSVVQYKVTFRTRRDAFAISTDPDSGESFSKYIADLNGTQMDSVKLKVTGKVSGSTIVQQKKRNQAYREQAKARDLSNEIDLQKKAAAQFDAFESEHPSDVSLPDNK